MINRRKFLKASLLAGTGLYFMKDAFASSPAGYNFTLGVCAGIDKSAYLKSLGYDYIEPPVGELLKPREDEEAFRIMLQKIKESPLPVRSCINFIPSDLKSVGPETKHPEIIEYATTAFRRARSAGMKYIVFGSGGSRRIPDNWPKDKAFNQFRDLVKLMAPVAAEHDIVIVMEPLNKGEVNFINSLEEGAELVKSVNHKNVKLLADIYHMLKENEPPDEIIKYGNLLYHCHIAEKEVRSAPGIKGDDFRPYLDALKKAGYMGGISMECRWGDFDSEVKIGIDHLRSL